MATTIEQESREPSGEVTTDEGNVQNTVGYLLKSV